MASDLFTGKDREVMAMEGVSIDDVLSQIEIFKRGVPPMLLERPCTVHDGIVTIPETERQALIEAHDEAARQGHLIKFVPASGAASRMFKEWFTFEEMVGFDSSDRGRRLADELPRYAFYDDLREIISQKEKDLETLLNSGQFKTVLNHILTAEGLNYGHLPKALLKFHRYPDRNRTSLEEHLVEAVSYVQDADHICRLHFTVSEEHRKPVDEHIAAVKEQYENKYGVRYDISLSIQLPSTNTIAVDLENIPFRDDRGHLLFRPGGHGALIKNLNAIDTDIIFMKNIDNVIPDRLKQETNLYKKILGGYLVKLQGKIHMYLHTLIDGDADERQLTEIEVFCREYLFVDLTSDFKGASPRQKKVLLIDALNRPLRVCGMVKNEGEPGGGPFWVNEDGKLSLQIVEQAQVDFTLKDQQQIWSSSTHFNPVDIVCAVKDYKGQKFDLQHFVDTNACFISEKSQEGRTLKALELPGLWNGAMARWNTVFVEVPLITFNPVKAVQDLLREEHLTTL